MGAKAFTVIEIDRAKRLKRWGYNIGQIARELGRSRSGVERILGDLYSKGLTCSDCSTSIADGCASGRCRSCNVIRNNKKPELVAKRMAGKREAMRDPIKYARACQIARNNIRKAMADPVKRAKFVELGKIKAATYFADPSIRAQVNDPALRKAIGRKISETRMAWCPPEYREAYHDLLRLRLCNAAEGRALIEEQIKADRARARSILSPFERQERALRSGAQLIANDQKPSLANPGVYRAEDAA
jgi:hypothetical protein